MYKFQVLNENGLPVATFTSAVEAWAYAIARQEGNLSHDDAKTCAEIADEMWLKGENNLDIGGMVDYIVAQWDYLEKLPTREAIDAYLSGIDFDEEDEYYE